MLCALGGVVAIIRGILSGRRPPYEPAGSTVGGSPPEAIEGRAEAIVVLNSPATDKACVQYEEKIKVSAPPGEMANAEGKETAGEVFEDFVGFEMADRAVGAFLVTSAAGKAIVWPGVEDVSYMDGWTTRKNDYGDRKVYERYLRAGVIVRVRGVPGKLPQMMSEMETEAEDLPSDLLRALESRADLASLPCYWPRKGRPFSVKEEGAELDAGDEETGPVAHFVLAGVAFLLAAALLYCAYGRLF